MCWTAMRFVYFGFSRCYIVGMWTDVQLWEKWMLSATDNLSSFVEIHSKVGDRRPCCGRLRSLLWLSQIHSDPPLQWSSQIHSPWSSSSSYWSLITLWCGQLKLGMMAMHQIRIGAYSRIYAGICVLSASFRISRIRMAIPSSNAFMLDHRHPAVVVRKDFKPASPFPHSLILCLIAKMKTRSMTDKSDFAATAVISLHLCDQGVQEGPGGESRMLQRPAKRFIPYTGVPVCTSLWWGVPGTLVHCTRLWCVLVWWDNSAWIHSQSISTRLRRSLGGEIFCNVGAG